MDTLNMIIMYANYLVFAYYSYKMLNYLFGKCKNTEPKTDEVLNKVDEAIERCLNEHSMFRCTPINIKRIDFTYLPKHFVLTQYGCILNSIWDELPERLKNDVTLQLERECQKHYNWRGTLGYDDWDGPNPKVKDCEYCKREGANVGTIQVQQLKIVNCAKKERVDSI